MLQVESDIKADAIYIQLTDEPIGYTKELDDNRLIDYSMNPGQPVGIDLLAVSEGVKLNGLPRVEIVEGILKSIGVKTHTE